jgi:uncharacterized protein YehS (DUF1456 family)
LHEHLCFSNNCHHLFEARFTLGVRANVQPKSSIPIGAKVEVKPEAITLGVKADIEKNFSICPKLVINAEHYGLVLAPRQKEKRIPSNLGGQFATLGANVSAFTDILT